LYGVSRRRLQLALTKNKEDMGVLLFISNNNI
jgi:hypothetical protein